MNKKKTISNVENVKSRHLVSRIFLMDVKAIPTSEFIFLQKNVLEDNSISDLKLVEKPEKSV